MLKNYFITAIRNIKRHKTFSFINLMGLAVGMAVCLLIMLYVQSELGYDKFHKDYDKIFRIQTKYGNDFKNLFGQEWGITTPAMLKDILLDNFSEVKTVTRIKSPFSRGIDIKYNGNVTSEKKFLEIDPSFFDMFDFEVIQGSKAYAMPNQSSVVVTKSFALRYFGTVNALNMTINIKGSDYIVTAVLKDIPANSHLKFEFLLPLVLKPDEVGVWNNTNFATYIKLNESKNAYGVGKGILELPKYHCTNSMKDDNLYLMQLDDIHFNSNTMYEFELCGNINSVYGLITLALIVLALACINFMNLSMAKSSTRTSEISLRKSIGAGKPQIIKQFLMESIVITCFAICISIFIVYALIPFFNRLAGTELDFNTLINLKSIPALLVLVIITGVIAGSYPAFAFSSLKPAGVSKIHINSLGKRKGVSFRRSLILFQFIICSLLITGVMVIAKQQNYINNKSLGYSKDQIVVIPFTNYRLLNKYNVFKNELSQYPFIQAVSMSSSTPEDVKNMQDFFWDNPQNNQMFSSNAVDADYFKTYDIKLKQGRFFDEIIEDGSYDQFILNESAVKYMNLVQPIGVKIGRSDEFKGRVVGVVKDFHFKSLHEKIAPLILSLKSNGYSCMSIKVNTENMAASLAIIKSKFSEIIPDKPFVYSFFDEQFEKMYEKEIHFAGVINTFAFLAIFIAGLGLLGLVAFTIEKRRKEISIRKVLGAEIKNIVYTISKEFLLLIFIANLISMPLAYYAMSKWLDDFAYKTNMSWWIFVLSLVVSIAISIVIIGYQALKAARANPVNSLRSE